MHGPVSILCRLVCLNTLLICLPLQAAEYDSLVQQGLTARNQGEFAEAERLLREAYPLSADRREITYLLGMVLAFQSKFAEAEAMLESGMREYPDDVQLRNGRARVYLYRSNFSDGRRLFLDALNSEPENLETLIGLYDAEMGLGNRSEAEAYLAQAQRIAPSHIDVESRLNRNTESLLTQHQLLWGFSASELNKPWFDNWYDRFVEYRHFSENGNQQFLRMEHDHRFGLHDSMVELGFSLGTRSRLPIDLSFAMTDAADFLPEHKVRIGTRWLLNGLLPGAGVFNLSYQQASYNSGTTRGLNLNTEYYLNGTNAWITPGIGIMEDENGEQRSSWQFGVHDQLSSRLRIGMNYVEAPETENNVTNDSRTGHVYLSYQFSERFYFRLDLTRNLLRNAYNRNNLGASLQYRF